MWGFALGVGLTTRWPTLQLASLAVAAALSRDSALGALLLAAFGCTRGLVTTGAAVVLGSSLDRSEGTPALTR
ncbi:MAG: hypothetical protein RMK01_12030 [Thermomicrobium sp.]|nr:hypothetical protein [Thermomicrobium sp.]